MKKSTDLTMQMLEEFCREAKEKSPRTRKDLTVLSKTFGPRFAKAWQTVKEERVKKYVFRPSQRTVWIVVGKQREYLVLSAASFCSCDDFYFRVMDQEVQLCYHLIAQKIANILKWYETIEERDELYGSLMEEWKKPTP